MKARYSFSHNRQGSWFYSAIAIVLALIWQAPLIAADNPATGELRVASVLEPGAKVELLAEGFKFTEGPAVDKDGNVFFTDQPNNRIMKWSVEGKLSTFLQPCGRANGTYFDRDGNLIACADETNQLWSISPSGKITILVKDYQGKLLNGPNDLWVNPKNGVVYFTDPLYKRDYWKRGGMEQDGQHVYYLSPDHQTLRRAAEGLKQPNGIIGTPDGKQLYVADIGDGKTYVYAIQTDGTLTDRQLFCKLGSDGMTIDNEGNVYLTGRGVTVFNSRGQQIDQIPVNKGWTANVCFGGKGQKMLFITASDSLYGVRMRVHGVQAN
jgi:gluconolactonase